uniref:Uncharacterized protein n=1 Tax=Anguilla anguilla TaxID=7936 RepID=A0A0E9RKG4_ANGAN
MYTSVLIYTPCCQLKIVKTALGSPSKHAVSAS